MSSGKLNIAFLWHHHQPFYKDPYNGIYSLPWVRFHGVKDYYDMVAILDQFPSVRLNFNLVPSLLKQIEDYVYNKAVDRTMILTLKDPGELSSSEKKEILNTFFLANWTRMIEPYPRYRELLEKRGRNYTDKDFETVQWKFKDQDFLDLQVWYNLCWIGESHKRKSPFKELFKKGKAYTKEDKETLIESQRNILRLIIPKYRELARRGQIEISVSPFYHPILPLLCDTNIAKKPQPKIALPKNRFYFPEDANIQLKKSINYIEPLLGTKPQGIWPSEGAVSEDVLKIASANGIKWMATDEEILFQSLKISSCVKEDLTTRLYQPYQFNTGNGIMKLIFRDHSLSDLIGFVYAGWEAEKAAQNFIERIYRIRKELIRAKGEKGLRDCLVSIILDGENCWENYPNNGRDFLQSLYNLLSKDDLMTTVTIGNFLDKRDDWEELSAVFPGSWINHDFSIWIGHEEDNTAWDYLSTVRNLLAEKEKSGKFDQSVIEQAREEILIAEGSDWCWWYGSEHISANSEEFDRLFRSHLIRAYEFLSQEAPEFLYHPIRKKAKVRLMYQKPRNFISPQINGISSAYFEWKGAGFFDCLKTGGAMHQTSSILKHIYYGFDLDNLYLRIDTRYPLKRLNLRPVTFTVDFFRPSRKKIAITADSIKTQQLTFLAQAKVEAHWEEFPVDIELAFDDFLELKIPFKDLGFQRGQEVSFRILLEKEGERLEEWPFEDIIIFITPDESFEQIEWQV